MLYQEIFVEGIYEGFCSNARGTGRIIVDIGANSGLSTLYMARNAPGVPVLAVEPVPTTYGCLSINLARHVPTAVPIQLAVSTRLGAVPLTYYPRTPSQSGLYANRREDDELTAAYLRNIGFDEAAVELALDGLRDDAVETMVPCARLEDLLEAFHPDVNDGVCLKIDVERAELDVLEGVGRWWPATDSVICEVEDRGGQLTYVIELLKENGLTVHVEQQAMLAGSRLWLVRAWRSGH